MVGILALFALRACAALAHPGRMSTSPSPRLVPDNQRQRFFGGGPQHRRAVLAMSIEGGSQEKKNAPVTIKSLWGILGVR
jgi:hypothetical protein